MMKLIPFILLTTFVGWVSSQNPVDCKKLPKTVMNSSWIEAEQLVEQEDG